MKKIKKCTSIFLAMLILLVFSVSVAATNADLSGHTYESYQILKGTQAEGSDKLASIEWGEGVNGDAFLAALKATPAFGEGFTACTNAADVAEVIAQWGDDSIDARAFAKLAYNYKTSNKGGTTGLDSGYYLVVDATSFGADDVNTVYNLALLQLTNKGDFEIKNKVSVPEVKKEVKDANDTTGTVTDWQDSADHDIGDNVPFRLTAKLASIADYDTYKVVFHDTLSAGLTYNSDAVVRIDNYVVTGSFDISAIGNSLTVSCNDVKALGADENSVITVEYTAMLNENAVLGAAGNPNSVYLEYSNNPNESGLGSPSTGKTPIDQVIVYTYMVIIDKTNEENQPLVGATFELFKQINNGSFVSLGSIEGANVSTFEWTGLDDGVYMLREVEPPKGFNKIEDMKFTVVAEHDIISDTPTLTLLAGRDFVTDADLFTGNLTAGTLNATVIDKAGIVIPETGGPGATIFYVLGAVLLLGASVILVARKRMNDNQ